MRQYSFVKIDMALRNEASTKKKMEKPKKGTNMK